MVKKLSKRLLALLLSLCIVTSLAAVGIVGADAAEADVAATGNPITEQIIEQMIDDGLRVICMGMDALGEATGEEGVQEAFSLIEEWCFMSTTEVAIEELKELCQEILNEIKVLEEQVDSNDTYITSMIANQSILNATNYLDKEWDSDVTAFLSSAKATDVLEKYKTYLTDAVNEKPEDVLRKDQSNLIDAYEGMASVDTTVFDSDAVNDAFISLLSNLRLGLYPQSVADQTCADYAAQLAHLAYPFSHQQYQYVHTVMEQQIMTILLVEMAYNEFLYQQGKYLSETYHDEDDPNGHYAKYLGYQRAFYSKMTEGDYSINSSISKMLDHKMNVNGSGLLLGIDDYMKPEDAVKTTMKIIGHDDSFDARKEWCDAGYGNNYSYYEDMSGNISEKKYIEEDVIFRKVMTHTSEGNKVYYIIDPEQFKGTDALYIKNLDHNCEFSGLGHDTHTESCDAHNLMKEMSDGANTFIGITDKDCQGFNELIATNYFSLKDSKLQKYLSSAGNYLPDASTNPTPDDGAPHNFVLTSVYNFEENAFKTEYTTFSMVDCNKSFPDEKLSADYGMYMEKGQNSKSEAYTVILRNKNNTFSQKAHAKVNNPSAAELQISADDIHYYYNGETLTAEAGTEITVRMKMNSGKFNSLKMIRNPDAASVSESKNAVETVLIDENQLDSFTPDAEGYITAHFTMPYSDATFYLDVSPVYSARIEEQMRFTGNLVGYDAILGGITQSKTLYAEKGTQIDANVKADVGYIINDLVFYNDDTNKEIEVPHRLKTIVTGSDNTTTYSYSFEMPDVNVKISARMSEKNTARINSTENCTATLGYSFGYYVTDTHETVYSADKGEKLVVIIAADPGYGPSSDSLTFTDTATGQPLDIKTSYDVKDSVDGKMIVHAGFTMPDNSVTIDVKCLPCTIISTDPEDFAYDSDNNPVSYIQLLDSSFRTTDESYVQIPSASYYYIFYIYDTEEHYLKHFKVLGSQTGTVYYDKDLTWDMDHHFDYLSDNVSTIGFSNNREKRTNKHLSYECSFWFGTDSSPVPIPESLLLIPTFEANEKPVPTEPPTMAPTDIPTEAPTMAPTEVPTEAPTVAPTEVPTEAPTMAPTEVPTEPEPTSYGIRNYDELIAFRDSVNNGEVNADAYLENNIVAPDDSVWTDGIGANGNAFNGSFDGKGYYIVGLNVDNAANGGLFDTIGKDGVVKDLAVIDCDFSTRSAYAGGVAAVNEGTIDHCTSGINLSGKTHINGKTIDVAAYNSFIYGTQSGGITAVNKGVITGSRNGATVSGAQCGGIACVNEGSIYACANNGAVGREERSCAFAGGLAGENNARIESSYNSGKVNCDSIDGTKGFIVSGNYSEDVKNNFYPDFNNIAPVAVGTIDSSNKLVKNSEMQKEAFVDSLNAVTDDSVTWAQTKYGDTFFNQGYPTILGRYLKQRIMSLSDNIRISGLMHNDLQMTLHSLAPDSDEYKALLEKGGILSAYSIETTDGKGNFAPSELWIAGGYQLTLPTGGRSLVLLAQSNDGEVVTLAPDRVGNGTATFTVGDMSSFAVAETGEPMILLGDVNLDGTVDSIDATLIQRYDVKMIGLSDDALRAADVDGDGEVTVIDATWIQRYDVRMKAPEGIGKPII